MIPAEINTIFCNTPGFLKPADKDRSHFLTADLVQNNFILSVDSQPRTVVAQSYYQFNTTFEYEICDWPEGWVGGRFAIRDENGTCVRIADGNPAIDFTGFEGSVPLVLQLPNIGSNDPSLLQPIDIHRSNYNEYILYNAISDQPEKCSSFVGQASDQGLTWMLYDPRLDLKVNTPSEAISDGGGATEIATGGDTLCSNVPRTFLNIDECALSMEATTCGDIATPVTEFILDEKNIYQLHKLTGMYVYGVLGLMVKQDDYQVNHPCTKGARSRWVKSSAPCNNKSTLQPSTNQSLTSLLLEWGEDDQNRDNPLLRDIYFPQNGQECDVIADTDVEVEIEVGSDCWTHGKWD